MIYCFDLDDTICFPNHNETNSFKKYGEALPNTPVIEKLRELSKTNTITIFTARRMLTHKGDVNRIIEDIGDITETWLDKYDVPYDNIIYGKPYADYYIDDKAVNLNHLKEI